MIIIENDHDLMDWGLCGKQIFSKKQHVFLFNLRLSKMFCPSQWHNAFLYNLPMIYD